MNAGKRRGRPLTDRSGSAVDALLKAAEQCVREKPVRDIKVTELGAMANVNPSLINYYFDNKQGLFVALIEFLFVEWERRIGDLIAKMPELTESPTKQFVALVYQCYYQHAPIIQLLRKEIADETSGINAAYRQRLASRTTQAMTRFVQRAIELGHYRKDVDLRFASLTLGCLAIHPFSMNAADIEGSYGVSPEELGASTWLQYLEESIDRLFAAPTSTPRPQ